MTIGTVRSCYQLRLHNERHSTCRAQLAVGPMPVHTTDFLENDSTTAASCSMAKTIGFPGSPTNKMLFKRQSWCMHWLLQTYRPTSATHQPPPGSSTADDAGSGRANRRVAGAIVHPRRLSAGRAKVSSNASPRRYAAGTTSANPSSCGSPMIDARSGRSRSQTSPTGRVPTAANLMGSISYQLRTHADDAV